MSEFAITVWQFQNARGLRVPLVNFGYTEVDTGAEWFISCGGTRGYFVRVAHKLENREQAPDSHFMMRRLTASLLLTGYGLFRADVVGRVLTEPIEGNVEWHCAIEPFEGVEDLGDVAAWYQCFSTNTFIRRAAEDVYAALLSPHEAFVYIYRGFEWITKGFDLTWSDVATAINVPPSHLRDLKRMANDESGIRHASKSGKRNRAVFTNYSTWVAGLIEVINVVRPKVDSTYNPMSAEDIAAAIWTAAPVAFP